MGFFRQSWTLTKKNLLILAWRHWLSTVFRALILPLIYIYIISLVRLFFLPPSTYGIGEPRPIRNISDAFQAQSNRDRVVLVDNGFIGGQIEELLTILSFTFEEAGADVRRLSSESDISTVCRSSLLGTSRCYGGVSVLSSPTEGSEGHWDYTVFTDWGLGLALHVNEGDNDSQLYALPFIHAINLAIASASDLQLPEIMLEYPFTSQTFQEREDEVQSIFMAALVRYLGLVIFIAICGITFELPGHVARERELGMSSLIDTMSPQKQQWRSHATRIFSTTVSFTLIYLPGSLGVAGIVASEIFYRTSTGMQVLFHFLMCTALASSSCFAASFFRKAQLSGITIVVVSCLLAVIAQWGVPETPAVVAILAVLFPPVNYVLFTLFVAAWEESLLGADFNNIAPHGPAILPGWFFFVAALFQFMGFIVLNLISERFLYGTISSTRGVGRNVRNHLHAVELDSFTKTYRSGWPRSIFPWKPAEAVYAVQCLSITAKKGQIIALLGPNGSGKTTTLSAITGQERATSGSIQLEGDSTLGLCPQRNILWEELTVAEHVSIFNHLKSKSCPESKDAVHDMIRACDLDHKRDAQAKTLSGGQKRKLQLAMSFIGGSRLCCIDEASSGIDPVSRRKIWNILLSERGRRTLLLTTHALDEADALSDHIFILNNGKLSLEGSAVELKQKYGGGYQVVVPDSEKILLPELQQYPSVQRASSVLYHIANPVNVGNFIKQLENLGIQDYDVNGPTIEQVFLQQANTDLSSATIPIESTKYENSAPRTLSDNQGIPGEVRRTINEQTPPPLPRSQKIGFVGQFWVLFRKRVEIVHHHYLPYFFALLIPTITAGMTTSFLTGFDRLTCSPDALDSNPRTLDLASIAAIWGFHLPVGPRDQLDTMRLLSSLGSLSSAPDSIVMSNTRSNFDHYISENFRSTSPGGIFLGDESSANPTIAYRINQGIQFGAITKSIADGYLMNTNIVTRFSNFALPLPGSTGDSLQLVVYFGLAISVTPGLFALYPSYERLKNIRALQYSNGVRPAPLWLAHLFFDTMFVILICTAVIVIFVTVRSEAWFAIGYLWTVLFFFGISSTLFSYVISLFSSTQLATFAFAAGYQAISLLIYFILYLVLLAFSMADNLQQNLNLVQYTFGLLTPSGNVIRALLLTLNQSQILCDLQRYRNPGSIEVYGAPILYLILQSIVMYTFLVCYDSGYVSRLFSSFMVLIKSRSDDEEEAGRHDQSPDVMAEIERVERSPRDALRVLHVSKEFTRNSPVVSDLTFGVQSSECLALLGPNGAGKTTTISLVRGELTPTRALGNQHSDITIDGHSLKTNRSHALLSLGVCPQFDAIDLLTVQEHLKFYARIAGIPRNLVQRIVSYTMKSVGIERYAKRIAGTLSGGNKRKLSLAIAVVGNPKVLLLDEPSSGMDAISKRVMWKALEAVKNMDGEGKMAMVITSHSMEEVTALADRVCIMRKHMLVVGNKAELCRKFGNKYHVHLLLKDAEAKPEVSETSIRQWVERNIPGVMIEREMLYGQIRFIIPGARKNRDYGKTGAIGLPELFRVLEENKEILGIEYYSIVQTSLEDVFLNVVGQDENS